MPAERPSILPFKGAFCIPDALPGLPFGDGRRIWTPAFGCYEERHQDQILRACLDRGHTHFMYNWVGWPYGSDYPCLQADPKRTRRDLQKIQDAGLLAIVCLLDEIEGNRSAYAEGMIDECGDLIPISMLMWECNEVLRPDVWNDESRRWTFGDMIPLCVWAANRLPKTFRAIHFTSSHGAGGDNEPLWWTHVTSGYAPQWLPPGLLQGQLHQTDFFHEPRHTGEAIESTAVRLTGKIDNAAWAHAKAECIAFEQQTTMLYHRARSEAEGIWFTRQMLPFCPTIAGWMDSGPK